MRQKRFFAFRLLDTVFLILGLVAQAATGREDLNGGESPLRVMLIRADSGTEDGTHADYQAIVRTNVTSEVQAGTRRLEFVH